VTEARVDRADRVERIRRRLEEALAPETLEIVDESHLHAGHPGARGGAGHYRVRIVAAAFRDQPLRERHRMVYAALAGLMPHEIHALAIDATTP
jgi:BolA protein